LWPRHPKTSNGFFTTKTIEELAPEFPKSNEEVFADNFDYLEDAPAKQTNKPSAKPSAKPNVRTNMDSVIDRLIDVENATRNPHKVGDKHLQHKAYGLLQIRKPYLDDANRIAGTKLVMATWGKPKLTIADMKDEAKARWVAKVYLQYYGREYTKATGRSPNLEVYGRIHNGGPDGWQESNTNKYARKLKGSL
jgi:hypothetical protein